MIPQVYFGYFGSIGDTKNENPKTGYRLGISTKIVFAPVG